MASYYLIANPYRRKNQNSIICFLAHVFRGLMFFIPLMFVFCCSQAQRYSDLIQDFQIAQNDSLFLENHSRGGYKLYNINFGMSIDSSDFLVNEILGHLQVGRVLGPYTRDSSIEYIKIVSMDSAYKVRVGNIWIDEKRGKEPAMQLAYQLLTEIKNGGDYNALCHLYSDDKNTKQDCDLGWFYNTIMVKEFGDEIIKHKLDDIFIVETRFGFHVVKMLGNPYLDLKRINYVILRVQDEQLKK